MNKCCLPQILEWYFVKGKPAYQANFSNLKLKNLGSVGYTSYIKLTHVNM